MGLIQPVYIVATPDGVHDFMTVAKSQKAAAAKMGMHRAWGAVEAEKGKCRECRGQGWYVSGMNDDGEYTAEVCPACTGRVVPQGVRG